MQDVVFHGPKADVHKLCRLTEPLILIDCTFLFANLFFFLSTYVHQFVGATLTCYPLGIEYTLEEDVAPLQRSAQTPPSPSASLSSSSSPAVSVSSSTSVSPAVAHTEPIVDDPPISPCANKEEYRAHLHESMQKKRAALREERKKQMMEELQSKCASIPSLRFVVSRC